jgi:hypothetical protein
VSICTATFAAQLNQAGLIARRTPVERTRSHADRRIVGRSGPQRGTESAQPDPALNAVVRAQYEVLSSEPVDFEAEFDCEDQGQAETHSNEYGQDGVTDGGEQFDRLPQQIQQYGHHLSTS